MIEQSLVDKGPQGTLLLEVKENFLYMQSLVLKQREN
jgi:hypothetical protein